MSPRPSFFKVGAGRSVGMTMNACPFQEISGRDHVPEPGFIDEVVIDPVALSGTRRPRGAGSRELDVRTKLREFPGDGRLPGARRGRQDQGKSAMTKRDAGFAHSTFSACSRS